MLRNRDRKDMGWSNSSAARHLHALATARIAGCRRLAALACLSAGHDQAQLRHC